VDNPGPVNPLRKFPLFSGLSTEELNRLLSVCRRKRYLARETVFQQGDSGQTLFLILKGSVDVESVSADMRPRHLGRRGPGEYVGDMALFDDQPRSADVIAHTDCEMLLVDRRDLIAFLEKRPAAAWNIIRTLSLRLREASKRIEHLSGGADAFGRLAALLYDDALQVPPDAAGARILPPVTDDELAHRVCTTRETVNRKLSALRKMRVIDRRDGNLVVLDLEKLKGLRPD
jgi:CRP-like cAMP-binding protein